MRKIFVSRKLIL